MPEHKEVAVSNKRVLIVDKDPNTCLLYKLNLENEGMRVETTNDSSYGLKLIDSFKPDLIMIDKSMLNEDFADKVDKLRSTKSHKDLKLIALG